MVASLDSPAVMEGGCASEAHSGVVDGGGPLCWRHYREEDYMLRKVPSGLAVSAISAPARYGSSSEQHRPARRPTSAGCSATPAVRGA